MYDDLHGLKKVLPTGEYFYTKKGENTGEIRGIGGYDAKKKSVKAIVYRHMYSPDNKDKAFEKRVCFSNLPANKKYRYFRYTVNQDRGSGIDLILNKKTSVTIIITENKVMISRMPSL